MKIRKIRITESQRQKEVIKTITKYNSARNPLLNFEILVEMRFNYEKLKNLQTDALIKLSAFKTIFLRKHMSFFFKLNVLMSDVYKNVFNRFCLWKNILFFAFMSFFLQTLHCFSFFIYK